MTTITLPKTSQSGANEWADAEDNDVAIRDVVNGNLDNTNLSGSAGITGANLASDTVADTNLVSPNNSAYRALLTIDGVLPSDSVAATYMLPSAGFGAESIGTGMFVASATAQINGGVALPLIHFDDADYTVASKTQKLRLRAQVAANATQPTITFTFGLYPVTVAGGADTLTFTLGTVVASSTVAIASPAASTITSGVNSDFTIPADGAYTLGVVTSATLTNNSAVSLHATLQTRSV